MLVYLTLGADSKFLIKFAPNHNRPNTLREQKKTEFLNSCKDMAITLITEDENGKKIQEVTTLAQFIMMHRKLITKHDVVFIPYVWRNSAEQEFNLFCGFQAQLVSAEAYNKKSYDLIQGHIFEVLCDSDRSCYRYLIRLLAWVVQHPHLKPGIAPIFVGAQGCGKNIF